MASRLILASRSKLNCLVARAGRPASTLAPSNVTSLPKEEQEFRDKHLPRIGNRDLVGYGKNGTYSYSDNVVYPYPAIRWGENTAETDALMKKATGDWKSLSMEEKKALYRHSFCQTFSEINAPTSEWKIVWGIVFSVLAASCWIYMFLRNNVYDAMLPSTITREHQQAQIARLVSQRQGLVSGVSSKWDYEANDWKKN